MNKEIIIEKLSDLGNFTCKYDTEADLLSITDDESHWEYGIDIDGTVIFDFDKNRVLKNIDILIPKKLWVFKDVVFDKKDLQKANIRLSEMSLKNKSFNFPKLKCYTNKRKNNLLIPFLDFNPSGRWIKLSKDVYFYVTNKNELQGFYFEW